MSNCLLLRGLAVALSSLLIAAAASAQPSSPPARAIPGLTAEDAFPLGCVDCHVKRPDIGLDVRLSTLMKGWSDQVDAKLLAKARLVEEQLEGRHPEAAGSLEDIPAACQTCHGSGAEGAPRFAPLMHVIHLTGGEENHFLTLFQGECTHCHKLDAGSGSWRVPSAGER